MSGTYKNFSFSNDRYVANVKQETCPRLPPGMYQLSFNQSSGELYFDRMTTNHDAIVALPSPEFTNIMREVDTFLKPETKHLFSTYGFLYKFNILLHGLHGTGKTVIVNRVAEMIVRLGGVVIFNPNPKLLSFAFKMLEDVQPSEMTMVIFEEFEELLENYEEALLSTLDGEIQKKNVMFLATTNHMEKLPPRLLRPGRFARVIEIYYPGDEARAAYLKVKLAKEDQKEIPEWVKQTSGLSIDELKETVLSVKCLGNSLKDTVSRIREVKLKSLKFGYSEDQEVEYADVAEWQLTDMKMAMEKKTKGSR